MLDHITAGVTLGIYACCVMYAKVGAHSKLATCLLSELKKVHVSHNLAKKKKNLGL